MRSTTMLVIECDGNILLEQRQAAGLWGGLWSFPESDEPTTYLEAAHLELVQMTKQSEFRHTFTHFHLDIEAIHIKVKTAPQVQDADNLIWYDLEEPQSIGLTRPVTRILDALQSAPLLQ